MGMFDTIYPDGAKPIKTLCCWKQIDSFQTKALENLMDEYCEGQVGREVPGLRMTREDERDKHGWPLLTNDGTYNHVPHPKYHRFYAYDWCSACERTTGQWFQFDEVGKLTRYDEPVLENKYNEGV